MADSGNGAPLLQHSVNNNHKERPREPWKGEIVKRIVYAGLDAIVTSFALIASISAGRLSSVDVLVLGISNLVADGISMGFGDFVSSSTEKDIAMKERSVTAWDVENQRRIQELELTRQYVALGMNSDDASQIVGILSKYPEILVDEKMTTEKGLLSPDEKEKPWKNGLITFASFIIFGCLPILSYIILIPITRNQSVKFAGACVLSALSLALLGTAKAKIAGQNYAVSAANTFLNGAIAGAAAYAIVWILRNVAGLKD